MTNPPTHPGGPYPGGQAGGHAGLPAAVLWDLDGTIVDTEPYWIACERELVARFGGQWTDADAHSIVGFDLEAAAEVMRQRGGVQMSPVEIVNELMGGVIQRIRQQVPWRPGARELLFELNRRGVPNALVTMSWQPIADEVIAQLPSGTFSAVVTGDMVLNGKPHPEPYRRAAAELGVDPLSCVAIEDSPTGVASAEGAGCVTVAVPNVVDVPPAAHRIRIDSLHGVTPELLGHWVEITPPPPDSDGTGLDDRHDRPSGPPRRWRPELGMILAALLAVGLIAGGVWWFALRERVPKYEPGAFNVHAWVPYWELSDALTSFEQNVNSFHVISPFWFDATGVATIVPNPQTDAERAARFISLAQSRGVPVVPSIIDATPSGTMAAILADPIQRTAHVEALAAFAAQGNYAGVDIDYEKFAFSDGRDSWTATQPNWTAFITELGARLAEDGRDLYVSIPVVGHRPEQDYWVYDIKGIAPHVTGIRMMMYDYSTSEPGPIAPLEWVERGIAVATHQAGGPEKLILGIPAFGANWVVSTEGTCPADAPDKQPVRLDTVGDLMRRRSATAVHDPVTGEASFSYDLALPEGSATECVQHRQVNFVDEQGVAARMQLSVDRGMLGISLFALGFESPEVFGDIEAINATLATTLPPDSTP